MISELRLNNYKKFRNERIPLSPLTIFIGPNGSGKSSISSALSTLATIMRLGLKSAFPQGLFSFRRILNDNALSAGIGCGVDSCMMGLGISGTSQGLAFDYDIEFKEDADNPSEFITCGERLRVARQGHKTFRFLIGGPFDDWPLPKGQFEVHVPIDTIPEQWDNLFVSSIPEENSLLNRIGLGDAIRKIKLFMRKFNRYQIIPMLSKSGCDQYDGSGRQPTLKPDGANLAELVQYLQEEQPASFSRFKQWIGKYTQGTAEITDIRAAVHENKVFLNFYEKAEKAIDLKIRSFEIPGPLLSDGYRLFTALAALASCPELPSVAFFEEPEAHLHPHKLSILYDIFNYMTKKEPDPCQVLISTHSPYFLDHFKERPDSVILLNNGEAKRLSQLPDYERILSLYSLGEAWYSNVFEWGNP